MRYDWGKRWASRPASFLDTPAKPPIRANNQGAVANPSASLSLKEYERITNFLNFIRRRGAVGEFLWMLLRSSDDAELEEIITMTDVYVDEEREEECENDPGTSPSSDAEASGTISPRAWDEFFEY